MDQITNMEKQKIIKGVVKKSINKTDGGIQLSPKERVDFYKNLVNIAHRRKMEDFKNYLSDNNIPIEERRISMNNMKENLMGYGVDKGRTYVEDQNALTDFMKIPPLDIKTKSYIEDTSEQADSPKIIKLLKAGKNNNTKKWTNKV